MKFTTLWHHVYNEDRLREAYLGLKRNAAPGVDRVTWEAYGKELEQNLQDLSDRLKRGAYRAKPVKRAYIPKPDGRQRPLGVTTLEDKIVQRSTTEVLNAVYEVDFLGFSYGFRPGRSPHMALDALAVGLRTKKGNWVLDADIRGFFDAMDHEWLMRFIEHRIEDRRVRRHLQKWLKAGVLEDGERIRQEEGTPQGASISPVLANVYLHYVFDLWAQQWRTKSAHGDVVIVRFADDFIVPLWEGGNPRLQAKPSGGPKGRTSSAKPRVSSHASHNCESSWACRPADFSRAGTPEAAAFRRWSFTVGFEHRADAERFLGELRERFAKFHLELHPQKTRLIEFGRHAVENREKRGEGKPETFRFLGFTHICDETRGGSFLVLRQTRSDRMQAKLTEVKQWLGEHLHAPVPVVGTYLGSVVRGHAQYYGVPRNGPALTLFRSVIAWLWYRALQRRSQTASIPSERMKRLVSRYLPPARIVHPYPEQRLAVTTQGKSRMR